MHIDGGEGSMTRRRVRGRLGSSIQVWLWLPPARCQLPYGNQLMWWEWSGSIRSTRQSFHRNFVEAGNPPGDSKSLTSLSHSKTRAGCVTVFFLNPLASQCLLQLQLCFFGIRMCRGGLSYSVCSQRLSLAQDPEVNGKILLEWTLCFFQHPAIATYWVCMLGI